jgi:hypothetical protein
MLWLVPWYGPRGDLSVDATRVIPHTTKGLGS